MTAKDKDTIRGRPRNVDTTHALLTATLEVVAQRGYHEASIDEIVERAGSSKPTVYRRWHTKPALVAAAMRHAFDSAGQNAPCSGDPHHDLGVAMESVVTLFARPSFSGAFRALIGVATTEPELALAMERMKHERQDVLHGTLERVFKAPGAAEVASQMLIGGLLMRVVQNRPVTKRFGKAMVDIIFPPRKTPPVK